VGLKGLTVFLKVVPATGVPKPLHPILVSLSTGAVEIAFAKLETAFAKKHESLLRQRSQYRTERVFRKMAGWKLQVFPMVYVGK